MSDLSNSVIMPREDFIELANVAFDNYHVKSFGERTGTVVQTTLVCAALGAFFTGTTWGIAKAIDWLDSRKFQREHKLTELRQNNKTPQHS